MGVWKEQKRNYNSGGNGSVSKNESYDDMACMVDHLSDTVGELRVKDREERHSMQRHQYSDEKVLVLLFDRKRKSVDNRSENFEELSDTIVSMRVINNPRKGY